MTQQDLSSPDHRLDNLTNMRFVRAYARVRHHVFNPPEDDLTAAFLRGYLGSLEQELAKELGLPETMLVGRLVDLGRDLCDPKDGNGLAE